jgi:hypothetical protein
LDLVWLVRAVYRSVLLLRKADAKSRQTAILPKQLGRFPEEKIIFQKIGW